LRNDFVENTGNSAQDAIFGQSIEAPPHQQRISRRVAAVTFVAGGRKMGVFRSTGGNAPARWDA
jgi:hypothetical protein